MSAVLLAALAVLTPSAASAQALDAATTIYRIDDGSSFTEGCLPPCKCPISIANAFRGTFAVTLSSLTQFQSTYKVSGVNWTIEQGSESFGVTVSGTYVRNTGFPWGGTPTHQLTLELTLKGETVKFDSGVMRDAGGFPTIDISIARNGFYCWDQVFNIVAAPVSAKEIVSYDVKKTLFQQGCWPPCLCPIFQATEVVGCFDLVSLGSQGTTDYFAVVNVDWKVFDATLGSSVPVTGNGSYTRISGFAGYIDQMSLDLSFAGAALKHFESPFANVTVAFPSIATTLTMNNFYCYDEVFYLKARPKAKLSTLAKN